MGLAGLAFRVLPVLAETFPKVVEFGESAYAAAKESKVVGAAAKGFGIAKDAQAVAGKIPGAAFLGSALQKADSWFMLAGALKEVPKVGSDLLNGRFGDAARDTGAGALDFFGRKMGLGGQALTGGAADLLQSKPEAANASQQAGLKRLSLGENSKNLLADGAETMLEEGLFKLAPGLMKVFFGIKAIIDTFKAEDAFKKGDMKGAMLWGAQAAVAGDIAVGDPKTAWMKIGLLGVLEGARETLDKPAATATADKAQAPDRSALQGFNPTTGRVSGLPVNAPAKTNDNGLYLSS